MQNAELDKFVGADSISARFFEFLLIYGGVDFIFVGTDVLLRFGHATALTSHRDVIHYRVAASLPRRSVKHRLYIIYGGGDFIIYIVGGDVLLRFGHATALTSHRDVIHYRVAASLPRRPAKYYYLNFIWRCYILI